MKTARRALVPILLLFVLILACGREEPLGTLRITSEPAGASIVLDGVPQPELTPADLLLSVGAHAVTVALDGHEVEPVGRTVQVSPGRATPAGFTFFALGELQVDSTPSGADIRLDEADTGEMTPHVFVLRTGDHRVELLRDGYVDPAGAAVVTVEAGATAHLDRTLLPAGDLSVVSTPDGAAIRLDGVESGRLTPSVFTLPVGNHVVAVSRDGYLSSPDSITVDVTAGGTIQAEFTLTETGSLGRLAVSSLPSGATIFLDGDDSGEVTPHVFDLPAGNYAVQLERAGFRAATPAPVTVSAGLQAEASATLAAIKVPVLESVSNVSCVGCPALSDTLHRIELDGLAPPEVLYVKISQSFPSPNDPHYLANPAAMITRTQSTYWNRVVWNGGNWSGAMPSLFLDGGLTSVPVRQGYLQPWTALKEAIIDRTRLDPGFAVEVEVADFDAATLEVTIRLVSADAVAADADAVLHVMVLENPVLYDTPPGSEGETEFHWVLREFETLTAAPLPLAADAAVEHVISIPASSEWVSANLSVIAFVQHVDDLEILQAGYAGRTDR